MLEANTVAWGCSTRNGGQAQISSGRLKRSEWISRWGVDVARKMHAEICEAFDVFRDLIASDDIDCDPQDGGHFYIAHKPGVMPKLKEETKLLNDVFGYGARIMSREELHENHVKDQEAAGAVYEPDGTCIHAAKLAFGYQRMARRLGATVHPASPVMGWTVKDGVHPPDHAGRHGQGACCCSGHGWLHAAWTEQPDQEPADADPVEFDRHTAA